MKVSKLQGGGRGWGGEEGLSPLGFFFHANEGREGGKGRGPDLIPSPLLLGEGVPDPLHPLSFPYQPVDGPSPLVLINGIWPVRLGQISRFFKGKTLLFFNNDSQGHFGGGVWRRCGHACVAHALLGFVPGWILH